MSNALSCFTSAWNSARNWVGLRPHAGGLRGRTRPPPGRSSSRRSRGPRRTGGCPSGPRGLHGVDRVRAQRAGAFQAVGRDVAAPARERRAHAVEHRELLGLDVGDLGARAAPISPWTAASETSPSRRATTCVRMEPSWVGTPCASAAGATARSAAGSSPVPAPSARPDAPEPPPAPPRSPAGQGRRPAASRAPDRREGAAGGRPAGSRPPVRGRRGRRSPSCRRRARSPRCSRPRRRRAS